MDAKPDGIPDLTVDSPCPAPISSAASPKATDERPESLAGMSTPFVETPPGATRRSWPPDRLQKGCGRQTSRNLSATTLESQASEDLAGEIARPDDPMTR